jgi:hypothetical protein
MCHTDQPLFTEQLTCPPSSFKNPEPLPPATPPQTPPGGYPTRSHSKTQLVDQNFVSFLNAANGNYQKS